jgi:hypothetical protein
MENSGILKAIKSRGYWRVLIRPSKYVRDRILSINKCEQLIKQTKVSIRGWDFPHMERNLVYEKDYIESATEFHDMLEFWRIYKSGQFIFYSGFMEDWFQERVGHIATSGWNRSPMSSLDIILTLFRMTEVYEFTARFIEANQIDTPVELSIKLVNTQNRALFFSDYSRPTFCDHICKDVEISYLEKKYPRDFLANATGYAINTSLHVFSYFDWGGDETKRILTDYQADLLNRKM